MKRLTNVICKILFLIVVLVPFFAQAEIIASHLIGLDSLSWFNCADKEECVERSQKIKSQSRDAYMLSGLLSEYLREKGEPVDLEMISISEDSKSRMVNVFSSIILEKYKIALKNLEEISAHERETFTFVFLYSLANGEGYLNKDAINRLLNIYPAPFLILENVSNLLSEGECSNRSYKILKKRYKSKFNEIRNTLNLIKCLDIRGKYKKVQKFVSTLDISRLNDEQRSDLFFLLANLALREGDISLAKDNLKKSISLNYKQFKAHRLLGEIYLKKEVSLDKVISALKNYLSYAPKSRERQEIELIVKKIEKESLSL